MTQQTSTGALLEAVVTSEHVSEATVANLLTRAVREVLDLHRPVDFWFECECGREKFTDDNHFTVGDWELITCTKADHVLICGECSPEDCDDDTYVPWVCDTVQRIETALVEHPSVLSLIDCAARQVGQLRDALGYVNNLDREVR